MSEANGGLRKALGPVTLWGLGVGYVISGEYFGWNLGLPAGGTYGMLAATLVVTLMYCLFVPAYAELACAIPRAGGAFVYGLRSHGPHFGFLAGFAQVVEFVFAPPAIAAAIGAYFGLFLSDATPEQAATVGRVVAIGSFLVFTAINAWGVKQAAWFEMFVTVAAVIELLIFAGVTLPSFSVERFTANPLPNGWWGAAAALPYAIWFYLAIEGVANAAEEARNPQRDVAIGFGSAMATLVVLALVVYVAAVGVGGWEKIVYKPGTTETSDSPLPLAMGQVVPQAHVLYRLLIGIGLFGLVASFHGIILAAGRATFELGRVGYAPGFLGRANARTHTPVAALLVNMGAGIVAILSGRTGEIITLSAFGALTLYIVGLLSYFRLRRTEPDLERPFRNPGHPVLPAIALAIAVASLALVAWYNPKIFAVYVALGALGFAYLRLFVLRKGAAAPG